MATEKIHAPGCDDAPLVHIPITDLAEPITLIVPYYEAPKMLLQQAADWLSLPAEVKRNVNLIVVDDGSQDHPLNHDWLNVLKATGLRSVRVFRILVDVRWNWLAARNIGVHHAAEGFVILTDIDHSVPIGGFVTAIYGDLNPKVIYRWSRIDPAATRILPHPNSWLMTRQMFWKIGGYDEALSGYYGTDGDFRRRAARTARIARIDVPLVHHENLLDASVTRYQRKQPEDRMVQKIIGKRRSHGKTAWRPKVLSFPYEEVTHDTTDQAAQDQASPQAQMG